MAASGYERHLGNMRVTSVVAPTTVELMRGGACENYASLLILAVRV